MSDRRPWTARIASDTLAMGVGDATSRGLLLLTGVLVSRELGPRTFGHYSYAIAVVGYGALIVDAGLTTYLVRKLVLSSGKFVQLLIDATVGQLLVAVSVAVLLTGAVALRMLPPDVRPLVLALLPLLPAQALNLSYALQARQQMRSVAGAKAVRGVMTFILCTAALYGTGKVSIVLSGIWFGQLASNAVIVTLLTKDINVSALPRPRLNRIAYLFRGGTPFLALAVVVQFIVSAPMLALPFFVTEVSIGYYAASALITQHAILASGIAATVAFPRLVRASSTNPAEFRHQVSGLIRAAVTLSLPLTVFAVLQAEPIMAAIFGADFRAASTTFAVLACLIAPGWVNTFAAFSLNSASQERAYLATLCSAATLGAVTFTVLASYHGLVGAAMAVALTELVITLGLARSMRVRLDVNVFALAASAPVSTWMAVAAVALLSLSVTSQTISFWSALLVALAGSAIATRHSLATTPNHHRGPSPEEDFDGESAGS